MSTPSPQTHRVRYSECDQLGMVFNSNYLVYADLAMTEVWRERLGGYKPLKEAGLDLVVAEANLQFRKSLMDDQEFSVKTQIHKIGNTSMSTRFTIEDKGVEHCLIDMTHVCVDATTLKPRPLPEWVREKLRL